MYRFLILCIGIVFLHSLHAQNTRKCNYISSGYYQLVYEADIACLEGNDSLAYKKLQEAEQTCSLLNQSIYQEMELYGMLLLKNKNFGKAIYYMEKLATEYGGSTFIILSVLNKDEVLKNNLLSEYPAFYDSILPAIMQKCNEFYTPERQQLAIVLKDILKSDQEIREDWEKKSKEDSAGYSAKLQETDSINAKRFFEIVKKYGYPNKKRYGSDFQSIMIDGGIQALLMHIVSKFNIEEMILQYVQEGECAPHVYGAIIDKGILGGKWKKTSLYGSWGNVKDDEIIDVLHVDERRMSIGMPTREMERKREKLMQTDE